MKFVKEKFLIIIISWFVLLESKIAQASNTGPLQDYTNVRNQSNAFREGAGFDPQTRIGSITSGIIEAFLGLLGIIFVILIITAGYNWMTAAGEEEKVNKAKDTIKRAIIGIIITIGAYAITFFVLSRLEGVDSTVV